MVLEAVLEWVCDAILEVVLEKDAKGAFMVTENDCAVLMGKLGLDLRPGVHVEGVQLCPNGRGVILITLKDGVKVDSFCRYDVMQVTESGIRSTLIKAAGKREVVINVKGIHPNTKDSVVLDYLEKFGKIVTTKVVHGVFTDGPLKNMKNPGVFSNLYDMTVLIVFVNEIVVSSLDACELFLLH